MTAPKLFLARALASASVLTLGVLLLASATAQAQAALTGIVTGAGPGTTLEVFKGNVKVSDLRVGVGGKYVLALSPGLYTVKCPSGKKPQVVANGGTELVNINCSKP